MTTKISFNKDSLKSLVALSISLGKKISYWYQIRMWNHCNHESFLEIKTYYSGFMVRYKRQRPPSDWVCLRAGPPHVAQQKSKPYYYFVPISLRVTFRPKLSPTCEYQPDHSDLSPWKGEALHPPHQAEPSHTDLPRQQSWKLGLVRQPPATLCERIHVTICKGWRFRVRRLELPKRIFLESRVISVSAQEAILHLKTYFLINWTVYFSARKQVFLYFMTM